MPCLRLPPPLTSTVVLLAVYAQLLRKSSPLELDLLQISVFDRLASSVVDALVKLHPKDLPVTPLVDDLTEVHLNYIESFRESIDDGGDDGFSQSRRQETLCYQFATLVHFTYRRLSGGLGEGFDSSEDTQQMRVSSWEDPVHARLQRRFVRFLASNVEEKSEEILSQAFDRLMDRVRLRTPARHTLSSSPEKVYTPWELSQFVTKVLRNVAQYVDLSSLAPKVSKRMQEEVAPEMGRLSQPLERLMERNYFALSDKELGIAEDMLNLGHLTVAGVLALWQVRSNIVGVQSPDSDELKKEFIRPLVLGGGMESIAASLPSAIRDEVVATAEEVTHRFQDAPLDLQGFAVLAAAVRLSVGEDFRSVVAYSTEADRLPDSRDDCFVAVLQILLSSALMASSFNTRAFYENLVAIAALEEALGTREPRRSVRRALQSAMRDISVGSATYPNDLAERLEIVDIALGMILRLPDGEGSRMRFAAFREAVDRLFSSGAADARGRCLTSAATLNIDSNAAEKYISGILIEKFDRFVGQALLSADAAASMPDLAGVFLQQAEDAGSQCGLSRNERRERIALLAGAVMLSMLETLMEEELKRNFGKVETLARKVYNVHRHPIVKDCGKNIVDLSVKMISTKSTPNQLLILIRGLDTLRKRVLGGGSTESGSSTWTEPERRLEDPELAAFLLEMQAALLKEQSNGISSNLIHAVCLIQCVIVSMRQAMGG